MHVYGGHESCMYMVVTNHTCIQWSQIHTNTYIYGGHKSYMYTVVTNTYYEPHRVISNNNALVTSKGFHQTALWCSLIRASTCHISHL